MQRIYDWRTKEEEHGPWVGETLRTRATGQRLQQPDRGRARRRGRPRYAPLERLHQTGSIRGPCRRQQHLHPAQGVDWPGSVNCQPRGQPSLVQESGRQYLQAATDRQGLAGILRQPRADGNIGQERRFGHLQAVDLTSRHPQSCHGLTLVFSSGVENGFLSAFLSITFAALNSDCAW